MYLSVSGQIVYELVRLWTYPIAYKCKDCDDGILLRWQACDVGMGKCLLKYDIMLEAGHAFVKCSYIETCFAEHVGWW